MILIKLRPNGEAPILAGHITIGAEEDGRVYLKDENGVRFLVFRDVAGNIVLDAQIKELHDGTEAKDAVNKSQLDAVEQAKQNKIQAHGENIVLLAPATAGGQPLTIPLAELASAQSVAEISEALMQLGWTVDGFQPAPESTDLSASVVDDADGKIKKLLGLWFQLSSDPFGFIHRIFAEGFLCLFANRGIDIGSAASVSIEAGVGGAEDEGPFDIQIKPSEAKQDIRAGTVDVSNHRITRVSDAEHPTDAVNKQQLDGAVQEIEESLLPLKVGTQSEVKQSSLEYGQLSIVNKDPNKELDGLAYFGANDIEPQVGGKLLFGGHFARAARPTSLINVQATEGALSTLCTSVMAANRELDGRVPLTVVQDWVEAPLENPGANDCQFFSVNGSGSKVFSLARSGASAFWFLEFSNSAGRNRMVFNSSEILGFKGNIIAEISADDGPRLFLNGKGISLNNNPTGTPPAWDAPRGLNVYSGTRRFVQARPIQGPQSIHKIFAGKLSEIDRDIYTRTLQLPSWAYYIGLVSQNSGELVVGAKYQILSNSGDSSFSNAGATSNDVGAIFTCTESATPTWGSTGAVCRYGMFLNPGKAVRGVCAITNQVGGGAIVFAPQHVKAMEPAASGSVLFSNTWSGAFVVQNVKNEDFAGPGVFSGADFRLTKVYARSSASTSGDGVLLTFGGSTLGTLTSRTPLVANTWKEVPITSPTWLNGNMYIHPDTVNFTGTIETLCYYDIIKLNS